MEKHKIYRTRTLRCQAHSKTCLFCIEPNGYTHVEYHWLWGNQVQYIKFLNFWIPKSIVKTLCRQEVQFQRNLPISQFTVYVPTLYIVTLTMCFKLCVSLPKEGSLPKSRYLEDQLGVQQCLPSYLCLSMSKLYLVISTCLSMYQCKEGLMFLFIILKIPLVV